MHLHKKELNMQIYIIKNLLLIPSNTKLIVISLSYVLNDSLKIRILIKSRALLMNDVY